MTGRLCLVVDPWRAEGLFPVLYVSVQGFSVEHNTGRDAGYTIMLWLRKLSWCLLKHQHEQVNSIHVC